MSQPLHLRHLSIIRDTVLKGKGSIFNYYTYESFNKLVEKGIGFWEAVVTVPDHLTAGNNFAASLDAVPELDDFGFPVIDSDLFCGSHNSATLGECALALKPDNSRISSKGPVLQRQADGTYGNTIKLMVMLHLLTAIQIFNFLVLTQHQGSQKLLCVTWPSRLRGPQNLIGQQK